MGKGFDCDGDSRLVERDLETSLLERLLDDLTAGTGRLMVLEGPAGIGKTRLLRCASDAARSRGIQVLSARASHLERNFPFGLVLQLFETVVAKPGSREDLLAGAAGLATPIFDGHVDANAPADEMSPLHGLYWLVNNITEQSPTLLVVDDVHWADPASLRFLLYLARRMDDLPLGIVIAARPTELDAPIDLLRELSSQSIANVMQLAALSHHATGILMRELWPEATDETCERIWRLTKGNPFLLREILKDMHAKGADPNDQEISEEVPRSINRALLARLARLPSHAAEVARVLSVMGQDATLPLVRVIVGSNEQGTVDAVDALASIDLVGEDSALTFNHPLIQAAVYESIPEIQRGTLHLEVARVLHEHSAPPGKVAAHLLQADVVLQDWAIDTLKDAAAGALQNGAPDASCAYLQRALLDVPSGPQRARILLDLAKAEALIDQVSALVHLQEATPLIDDPEVRAAAFRQIGHVLNGLGRHAEAAGFFERALEELPQDDGDLVIALKADFIAAGRQDVRLRPRAIELVDELRNFPPAFESRAGRQILTELALAKIREGGDYTEARDLLLKAVPPLAPPLTETGEGNLMSILLPCLTWVDELELATQVTEAVLDDARKRGSLMAFATGRCFGASASYRAGNVAEAAASAQDAIDASAQGWAHSLFFARAVAAHIYIEMEDLRSAGIVLNDAQADESLALHPAHPFVLEARSRLSMLEGRLEKAETEARQAGQLARNVLGTENPALIAWRGMLALSLQLQGRTKEALEFSEEEVALSRRYGCASYLARSLRAYGDLLGCAEGLSYLEESLEIARRSPARVAEAWTLLSLGRQLHNAGKSPAARDVLAEGRRLAALCGSTLLTNQFRVALVKAGARPRRGDVTGLASLTPGERRVVEMAAQGMTNRDIAEAQFVTVKAVEWHLINAYRKLGVRSRAELPALIEDDLEKRRKASPRRDDR